MKTLFAMLLSVCVLGTSVTSFAADQVTPAPAVKEQPKSAAVTAKKKHAKRSKAKPAAAATTQTQQSSK